MGNEEKDSGDISPSPGPKPSDASTVKITNEKDGSTKVKTANAFGNYLRIFTYSNTTDRIMLSLTSLAAIATGITLPLMNILFGKLTGSFAGYFQPGSNVTKADFERDLNHKVLLMFIIFLVRWACSYLAIFSFRIVGLRVSAKLRLEYLRSLFYLSIEVLDTLPTGLASNAITTSANVIQVGISEKLELFIQSTALLFSTMIVAFIYSWALTLVTSSVVIFISLVYGVIVPIVTKKQREVEEADGRASGIAGEVLGSVRMIIANGAEGRIAEKFSSWVEESGRRGKKQAVWLGVQFAPVYFALFSAHALCFWFGFKLYYERHIDNVSNIVIVLMSVMMLAFSVGQTAAPLVAMSRATSAAANFFSIIDLPNPSREGLKEPDVSARGDIVFDRVTFAYPSRPNVKVLDDISLRFGSGKNTAIVGASGSGKSTIVGLLERWYGLSVEDKMVLPASFLKSEKDEKGEKGQEDETSSISELHSAAVELSGSITCGGQDLKDVDVKWWRSQIGLVIQEPFIFNDTIYNNISYGLIGSDREDFDDDTKKKLVEEACKEAFADEFITQLPLGYETQVGDAGIKLSGGQRQRLAIARSIIRKPKILILDEATSSIDVRGEGIVQAALDRVSEGRTTITIAHRLSTIKKADKIIVLRQGKLIEEGSNEELLSDPDGAYWALVNAQQLTLGEKVDEEEEQLADKALDTVVSELNEAIERPADSTTNTYKPVGIMRSFGLFLWEQRRLWQVYIVMLIAVAGAASSNPISAYLFAHLIETFTFTGQKLLDSSEHWALRYFILACGLGVAWYLGGWSSSVIGSHITCDYRQQYFESILTQPISFFDDENHSSGTLVARVANDPTQLQQMLGINLASFTIAILNIIGGLILAFYYGWKLSLVVTFTALPIVMAAIFYRIKLEILFEKMNQDVFAESSKFAAEALSAFRTVTSLTLENLIITRYETLLDTHVRKAFKKARFSSILFAASDSVSLACMALAFWYGGRLLASREYEPFTFFVVYISVVSGAEAAGSFLSFGPNLAQTTAAANRILSFRLHTKKDEGASAELQDVDGGMKIEFKDVWFKYPTRDVPVLTGLNLTVEKGQFVGLVGASGCGKTTVISLLERFYDPQKGIILVNSIPTTTIPIENYRPYLSLVPQEPTLISGTLRENLVLGLPSSIASSLPDSQLHEVCRSAHIHDFIISLPDGYNTEVGSKGIALSGGQKQRIAIARAMVRDPKLLLLDEATSSLDSESERMVQKAFEGAGKGRTMVVVAHRLATVQRADVIFVLGEGKVLETGNHQSLLRKRGLYYQMCQSQALDR